MREKRREKEERKKEERKEKEERELVKSSKAKRETSNFGVGNKLGD